MAIRVVFVPGFMQRGSAWAPVADLLGERYPSALLDHREHDFEGRLREIASAARGAVVCGYSLGGRLALHAAAREPSLFAGLVTVGASAGIEEAAARAARLGADERLAAWMEGASIEDVVALWEREPLFADQADSLVEAQRVGRLSHDPRELASLLRSAGQGALEPVWRRLTELDQLPVLAIAGARDERYAAAARRLAELTPLGRAELVEHAGHAPQLQRPERVAALLAEFLDRHLS
ncbi:MAG: alpha/beta fold hydrolase [Thermoleophilaceae bacterium]